MMVEFQFLLIDERCFLVFDVFILNKYIFVIIFVKHSKKSLCAKFRIFVQTTKWIAEVPIYMIHTHSFNNERHAIRH